jgi:deoxycytidylate deaminase
MLGSELVIGLVGAAGADLELVSDSLRKALDAVKYDAHPIRISQLLHDLEPYGHLAHIQDQDERINRHMDAGNQLRQATRRDIMALLAIAAIRVLRRDRGSGNAEDAEDEPLPRTAYILNSLKREEEVALLQEVYLRSFILISAFASRHNRRDALAARIARSKNINAEKCFAAAEAIIDRDEFESEIVFGQNVRDTFPLADIFLDADNKDAIAQSVERAVSIVFGHPFETPTRAEIGMQLARTAALRSADLSRQVGYAACSDDGQVIALGTNEVAKPGGGLYWADSSDAARDFEFANREQNAEMKVDILRDLLTRLQTLGYATPGLDVSAPGIDKIGRELKGSTFMAITEYGRAVHAEMSVITDAARRGVPLSGATMYGTTFPCHNCAKNIVAAGVKRVVYIEPYPKSQVSRLFSDSITIERDSADKVTFTPFVGIAPQRFSDFFSYTDRKDDDGWVRSWDEMKSKAVPRIPSDPASYVPLENDKVKSDLVKALSDANITFAE